MCIEPVLESLGRRSLSMDDMLDYELVEQEVKYISESQIESV
jgi:hypothetical protein